MNRDDKMLCVLVAIGSCTSYAELEQATGLPVNMLMNTVGYLRRRGYVERISVVRFGDGEVALFRRSQTGDARLEAAPNREPVNRQVFPNDLGSLTMVQHALRAQPALATVWKQMRVHP